MILISDLSFLTRPKPPLTAKSGLTIWNIVFLGFFEIPHVVRVLILLLTVMHDVMTPMVSLPPQIATVKAKSRQKERIWTGFQLPSLIHLSRIAKILFCMERRIGFSSTFPYVYLKWNTEFQWTVYSQVWFPMSTFLSFSLCLLCVFFCQLKYLLWLCLREILGSAPSARAPSISTSFYFSCFLKF